MLRARRPGPDAGRPLSGLQPPSPPAERWPPHLPRPDRHGFSRSEADRHPYRLSVVRGNDLRRLEAPQRSHRPRRLRAQTLAGSH